MTVDFAGAALVQRMFASDVFPPSHGTKILVDLHREVGEARQAALIALCLRACGHRENRTADYAHAALEAFMALSRRDRLAVAGDPAFAVWLQRAAPLEVRRGPANGKLLVDALVLLPGVLTRCVQRLATDSLELRIPVEVTRHDIDPLVAEATPPTYEFPTPERARELDRQTAYSLEIATSVVRAALVRIGMAWPELAEAFPYYVRTIVHLPLGDFRSASASRYAGAIFLTTDDRTILEVEESLVHEWGHQLLYSVMELDPIVVDRNQGELALPWSGARRDFYGYFHALFVYTLLLRYLERIEGRSPDEQARVRSLFDHILGGAIRACPDFDDDSCFTRVGRELRTLLRNTIRERGDLPANSLKGGIQ